MYNELRMKNEEKNETIKQIVYFLTKVHPFLLSSEYSNLQCEIRLVCANKQYAIDNSISPTPHKKLFKLSNDIKYYEDNFINDKVYIDIETPNKESLLNNKINPDFAGLYYISSFLYRYLEKPYNVYYSLFNEKNTKLSIGSKSCKINNNTAFSTQVLPIDIDINNYVEYKKIESLFYDLGIELLSVFTGHGYHILILLDEATTDRQIFKKFTNLLERKGFPIDTTLVDAPRLLRLPNTWNVKKFSDDDNDKYANEPLPKTRIVSDTNKRYDLDFVFKKLETLPDVEPVEIINEVKQIIRNRCLDKQEKDELFSKYHIEKIATKLYDMCDFTAIHPTIKRILTDRSTVDYRHPIIYALTPYFKNVMNFGTQDSASLFNVWSRVFIQEPIPLEEIERYVRCPYKAHYSGAVGKYPSILFKKYGEIKIDEYDEIEVEEGNLKIKIPVSIMKALAYKDFWNMTRSEQLDISSSEHVEGGLTAKCHGAFRIYMLLKVEQLKRRNKRFPNANSFTQSQVEEICGISSSTFKRNIGHIVGEVDDDVFDGSFPPLLIRKKSSKKSSNGYIYELQNNSVFDTEFVTLESSFIQNALFNNKNKLSDSEFKVMCLIKFFAQYKNQKDTIWLSQIVLGGHISMERTLFNKKLHSLRLKDYIDVSLKNVTDSNGRELNKKVTLLRTLL